MDLVEPTDFLLRLAHGEHDVAKTRRARRRSIRSDDFTLAGFELDRASSTERADRGMEQLNLLAQPLLLGNPLVHSVQIHRHKFAAAIHELLRQRAQQSETLLEQCQIFFDIGVHGLRHFVEFVLFRIFGRADFRGTRGRGLPDCGSLCAMLRRVLLLRTGGSIGNGFDARR